MAFLPRQQVGLAPDLGQLSGTSCPLSLGVGVDPLDQRLVPLDPGHVRRDPGSSAFYRFHAVTFALLGRGRVAVRRLSSLRFALIELPLALVGCVLSSVGCVLSPVGSTFPVVRDPVAVVGDPVSRIRDPVSLVGHHIALVGGPSPIVSGAGSALRV
jgi:hypothetical protein